MIHDVIFEYCECLLRGLDSIAQFKPTEVLPPINLSMRSNYINYIVIPFHFRG